MRDRVSENSELREEMGNRQHKGEITLCLHARLSIFPTLQAGDKPPLQCQPSVGACAALLRINPPNPCCGKSVFIPVVVSKDRLRDLKTSREKKLPLVLILTQ